MPWTVNAARSVERKLARLNPKDQRLIREALVRLAEDPQRCNLERLESQPTGYRLRVGNWRLLVDVFPEQLLVSIRDLLRRTTTTYRRR
mgnify:CR=1 FL=1